MMFKTLCLSFLFLILYSQWLPAQENAQKGWLYQKFLSAQKDTTDSGTTGLFVVPVFGHTPESGYEYGASGFLNYYLPSNRKARPSNAMVKASLTSGHASNIIANTDVWAHNDKTHLYGEIRTQQYPFYYFGIGNTTTETNKILVKQVLSHVDMEGEQCIWKKYYVGGSILVEHQHFYPDGNTARFDTIIPAPNNNGTYASIGITQAIDTRDNIQYTQKGILIKLQYAYVPGISRMSYFHGDRMQFNTRLFASPVNNLTFGYDMEYNQLGMRNPPFYLLPQMGNDEIMRGYYEGRFRDRKLWANQIEVRYRFISRLAVVGFAAAGTTTAQRWVINRMETAIGSGIRYFFDINNDATIRLDYAIGNRIKGENRQSGFYLTLGEAF